MPRSTAAGSSQQYQVQAARPALIKDRGGRSLVLSQILMLAFTSCTHKATRGSIPCCKCVHALGGSCPLSVFLITYRLGATHRPSHRHCPRRSYPRTHSSEQRSPPVRRRVSGACQGIQRSNRPCETTTLIYPGSSSHHVLRHWAELDRTAVGTRPVCPVVAEMAAR